jgi:hypothetical protein
MDVIVGCGDLLSHKTGAIRAVVVDDENVCVRCGTAHSLNDQGEIHPFVVRRNGDEDPFPGIWLLVHGDPFAIRLILKYQIFVG